MEVELRFRAMGSDAHVIVVGGPAAGAERARRRIDELERRWSRFLPDSEVSELNRRAGEPLTVSADTAELVRRAIDAWWMSAGLFDPTLLGDLLRAGYDRSFEELEPAAAPGWSVLTNGVSGIEVDGNTVRLPPGVGFDPGGIGKGLAADFVAGEILAGGADGVCINLGGDVRVAGAGLAGEAWTVAVEHAACEAPVVNVGLADGAVATSTTLRRVWQSGGFVRHHIIDPHRGLPSTTDVNHATVVAAQAWIAEVLAKAVLLRGSEHPFDILGGTGAEGLAVTDTGEVVPTPGLAAYLGDAPVPARLA